MTNTELAFLIPNLCPSCGTILIEKGDFLFCVNGSCPSQIKGSIQVWVKNLGLLHWGDSLIDNLTNPEKPFVSSISDIYNLTIEQISQCCSGDKMAAKCYHTLHSNKDITLDLLFGSLNIPNFGLSTASEIVNSGYNTVEKILSISIGELKNIPGIGPKKADIVYNGIIEKSFDIKNLELILNIKKPVSGFLTNVSFCITGELSRPRKQAEKMILDAGGSVKGSVGKNTSYLVTNDPTTGSSKLQNAKKYGVKVINEDQLYALIDVNSSNG